MKAGRMGGTTKGPALRGRIESVFASREPRRIPDEQCDTRAAVVLVLTDAVAASRDSGEPAALFVRRARVDGDPWSGHMALPGGRSSGTDQDLLDTARRETEEEVGLRLLRSDFIGRLDDIHPSSSHLPSIAVTPWVAWHTGEPRVRLNRELDGYVWIPLSRLVSDEFRSTLRLEEYAEREFPAIEHAGDIIWGLTFRIVEDFLSVLPGTP